MKLDTVLERRLFFSIFEYFFISVVLSSMMTKDVLEMQHLVIILCLERQQLVLKRIIIDFRIVVWKQWDQWLLQWRMNFLAKSIVSQVRSNKRKYVSIFLWIECSQIEYCGNRHVDDGEECDCGFRSECTENCCYPAGGSDPKLACKLKPGAHCRFVLIILEEFN